MGFFQRLQAGLSRTKENLVDKVTEVFRGRKISEDLYDDLEEALIAADVGVETSLLLVERLRIRVKEDKLSDGEQLQPILEEEIAKLLTKNELPPGIPLASDKLNILVIIGVNGVGKTTTIGKLASRYINEGKKVLLAAGDTFRAAAVDQLAAWAKRAGVDLIRQAEGADPAALVFDAIHAAISRKSNVLLIDTAGRLQNKANLMEELGKIGRIIAREAPEAKVQNLLVLDAGTGQNAISQAKLFGQVAPLSGLILTKLDGTAKGGVIVGIVNETGLPIVQIGVGEAIEDLQDFNAKEFVAALFER
ncbi:MAG: signal recognition particle-docking protein FtsY [Clostridiales bacterium]|nr:signal recognition particle-docking protein FtsY [Clostridiales bacterium]